VGIVVYGSRGRVVLQPTSVVNAYTIEAAIEQREQGLLPVVASGDGDGRVW